MAKKSEATAKFKNLDNVIQNLEKLFDERHEDLIFDVVKAVKSDIATAGGYEEKESKSKTTKFLKAIQDYSSKIDKIANDFNEEIYSERLKIQRNIIKKYNSVSFNNDEDIWNNDDSLNDKHILIENLDQKEAAISEYDKQVWKSSIILKNKVAKQLKSTFFLIEKAFADFNNDLKKQNKPARRRLGHISKFCNDDAIGTLEKVPKFLNEYEQALINYLEKLAKYLENIPDD